VIIAIAVVGGVAVFVTWRLVARGKASVWVAVGLVEVAAALAALVARAPPLSPRIAPGWTALAGFGSGVALYAATAAFVITVRRWPVFDRHVAGIYDQRRGLPLFPAMALGALIGCAEEIFWRGLVQGRLASALGSGLGALVTWLAWVFALAASGSLPIVAGAVVGGAVWGGLALWTHDILASLVSHVVWTSLMVAVPPGGPQERSRHVGRVAKGPAAGGMGSPRGGSAERS